MSLLMIILAIIGAIPDIIAAVKAIWDWIKQIKDRKVRREMTMKLRKVVMSHLSEDRKTVKDPQACLDDLGGLQAEVLGILERESQEMLAKVGAAKLKKA